MTCPHCGTTNLPESERCTGCGEALAEDAASSPTHVPEAGGHTGGDTSETPTRLSAATPATHSASGTLQPGTVLGKRYEIVSILGMGGMGIVYRARDLALGRDVALKVIRPEMLLLPGILERFHREISLASKVTHKNILRIHDLVESDGLSFISMQYVDGVTLADVLERDGPLPAERVLALAIQLCQALGAAHDAGVVHRDLKPQNVLIDAQGAAYIADFGISRSVERGQTMTEHGAVIGTLDYMSPEQARGEIPDHRSDLYSLGMVLYKMLNGTLPFESGNSITTMLKRVQQDAPNLRQLRPEVPAWLAAIVGRALRRDREERYQSAGEMLRDLERQRAAIAWRRRLLGRRFLLRVAAGLGVLVLVVAAGFVATRSYVRWRNGSDAGAPVPAATSLVLLPFRNTTGDASYDWVSEGLPDLLRANLLQAKALRLAGPERVREVFDALKLARTSDLPPDTLRRVVGLLGVEHVLTGSLLKAGNRFRIEASVQRVVGDALSGASSIRVEGEGEEAIFSMVDELTRQVRDGLGLSHRWGEEVRGATELSTHSVEALKLHGEALALARSGKQPAAVERLERAVQLDPAFAMAAASLADLYDRLGYGDKAAAAAAKAVAALTPATPPYEAARIRAIKSRLDGDLDGAQQAYRELTEITPNSEDVWLDLAAVQEEAGELEAARVSLKRAVALDAKHAGARYALGRVQSRLGNTAEAQQEFNAALALHEATGDLEGRATVLYGLGNMFYYASRYDEALRHFEESLAISKRINDRKGERKALGNIAVIHRDQGRFDEAVRVAREALSIGREMGDREALVDGYNILGDIFNEAGRPEEAQTAYQQSMKHAMEIGDEASIAQNLGNLGYINTVLGRYVEAYYFQKQALDQRKQIGDKAEILRSQIDLGFLEEIRGRYDEAIAFYVEGLAVARALREKAGVIRLSANLAGIHADRGDYAAALELLDDAEAQARELEDPELIATCDAYRANVLLQLGDPGPARTALDEAARLAREIGNQILDAEIKTLEGREALARGGGESAITTLRQAVAAARATKDHRLVLLARIYLAEAERAAGPLAQLIEDAREAELAPVVARAELALARLQLDTGKTAEAQRGAERAIAAATPLEQRDLLFQAHHVAGQSADKQGRSAGAVEHYAAALELLEALGGKLKGQPLERLRARSQTTSYLQDAAALFGRTGRPAEANRLRAVLAVPPAR